MEDLTNRPRGSRGIGAIVVASALGVVLATGGCASKQERDQLRVEKQQLTDEKQKLADKLQSIQSESAEANATLEDHLKIRRAMIWPEAELPRTDSGKLLKRVLRDEYWKGRSSSV